MKRHKDSVSSPTRKGEAHVFVLSPELLEKLGIQLSNITCPPEDLAENSIVGKCKYIHITSWYILTYCLLLIFSKVHNY